MTFAGPEEAGVPRLEAFVPEDRVQALRSKAWLAPASSGAALFIDVSGFTPLTEALALAVGPDKGAEELSVLLQPVFSGIVGCCHSFGGSIITFAGDGILGWFDGDDGRCAVAAAAALQSMVRDMGPCSTSAGSVTIQAKASVVTGEADRVLLGDPAIQLIEAIGGPLLDRLMAADTLAEPGDLIVDSATARALAGLLETRPMAGTTEYLAVTASAAVDLAPAGELPGADLDVEMLRPWLHSQVSERLADAQGGSIARLRPVVVLFVSFVSFGAPASSAVLPFARHVQGVVEARGGILLDAMLGADSGALMALFGAPVTRGDDPTRAVQAAEELRHPLPGSEVTSVSIGAAAGLAFTGIMGGADRVRFGVMGDVVNVASRLMRRAEPGEILVGGRLGADVARRFRLLPSRADNLKGRSPVSVSSVLGRVTAKASPSTSLSTLWRSSTAGPSARCFRGSSQTRRAAVGA